MIRTRLGSLLSLLTLLLVAGPSLRAETPRPQAQADDADLKELTELLNIQIISVSKVAQRPIDAPGIVGAITRDQVREYGWQSLNDVLAQQPGFAPSQDYDRRTTSARGVFEGWNNNHMLLLVDGIPMNDNIYGSAYTSEVTPIFMAKSLEIMRGPGSALYGSNAVNGVVSINTLKAEDLKGRGEARLRVGDRATRGLDKGRRIDQPNPCHRGHEVNQKFAMRNDHVGVISWKRYPPPRRRPGRGIAIPKFR